MPPTWLPGLQLNLFFYHEAVRPLLDAEFPGLPHSAALIGYGSDVLGFDTPMSTDHNWGPRLQLFLAPEDFASRRDAVDEALRTRLPATFRGYSVNFSEPDWSDGGTQWMQPFAGLDAAAGLTPILHEALQAAEWQARQEAVAQASSWLACKQNTLGILPPVPTEITLFFRRPYRVIFAERIADVVQQAIADPRLRGAAAKIGGVDQISDCVDLLDDVDLRGRVPAFYA